MARDVHRDAGIGRSGLAVSSRIGLLRQEGSGLSAEVYEGFSWPAFLFGAFWYAAKGMWGMAMMSVIISLATLGFAWFLVFPFMANRHYREHLAAQGYRLVGHAGMR